jgi:cytidylate kinase
MAQNHVDTPTPEELVRVIALDGPAGSGKTTVAARTARAVGWRFVDTGATYRAATLAVLRAGADLGDPDAVAAAVAGARIELSTRATDDRPTVLLDGTDVSLEIRGPEVTAAVSAVSAIPTVRAQLIDLQRRAIGRAGAVVEGRDISTVVAPHAGVKVYLDARPEVRALRRRSDGPAHGELHEVQQALATRDALDSQTNKLVPSDGAVHLDTSDLSLEQVVDAVVELARAAGIVEDADTTGAAPATSPLPWVQAAGHRKDWLIGLARPFGWLLFHSAFKVRVVGKQHVPRTGAVLMAGNHTGFLDGPLAFALCPRPATFLTKSELFVGPISRALGWLGQIPVHRRRPDRAALRSALQVLQHGGAVGVFPEGTRGAGTLETVSDGVAYLAVRSGAPLVPIAVLGTSEAMPKGARLPRWRTPVTLVFGPPFTITVEGDPRSRRTVRAAAEQIRLALLAHVQASAAQYSAPESTS